MECNERDSSNNRHTIDLFSRFVLFFRRVVSCRDGINKYIKYDNKEKEKEGNNETHEFSRSRIQSGRKQRGGSLSLLHKRPTANSQQPTNVIKFKSRQQDGRGPGPHQPNRKNKIQKDNHIIMIISKQQKSSNKTKRTFTL